MVAVGHGSVIKGMKSVSKTIVSSSFLLVALRLNNLVKKLRGVGNESNACHNVDPDFGECLPHEWESGCHLLNARIDSKDTV